MLVAVYEEIWPWPVRKDSQPKVSGPAGVADGHARAHAIAQEKAGKFNRSAFVGDTRFPYWWGRDTDARNCIGMSFEHREASVSKHVPSSAGRDAGARSIEWHGAVPQRFRHRRLTNCAMMQWCP